MLTNIWLNSEIDTTTSHLSTPLFHMLKSLQFTKLKADHTTEVSKPHRRKSKKVEIIQHFKTKALLKDTQDLFKREPMNGIVILRLTPIWSLFLGIIWQDLLKDHMEATTLQIHQYLQCQLLNKNRDIESRPTQRSYLML
jgi:hypothetical protein